MYTVYVLRSRKDGNRYIGSTKDFAVRLKKHNKGQVKSTKSRKPFDVAHIEVVASWSDARKRENFLKSGQGREWLSENKI